MPKPRQTCTQCSLRRQKCDRGQPCGRCIKRGVSEQCTIHWASKRPRVSNPIEILDVSDEPRSIFDSAETPSNASMVPIVRTHDPSPQFRASATFGHRESIVQLSNPPRLQPRFHSGADSQLRLLQLLVPSLAQLQKLVNYAEKRILWYHGCYHGPTFNAELQKRASAQCLQSEDVLSLQNNDLQWAALLFAIIAGSLTCASVQAGEILGFDEGEARSLSGQWHRASITCLELANYTSKHTIHAVQAIATLTMCAHTLGRSGEQHVLMGSAIHLARALNLHRLKIGNEQIDSSSSPEARKAVLEKEVARRLFCQLCVQDWFSIPFTGAHSIHRGEYTTAKPSDRDYITMESLPKDEPNYVSYNNYLFEIAALIAQLHTSTARCNTDFTRYEQIMEVDARMRRLATRDRPQYFNVTVPIDPEWPWFVPWARRSLTICFAHKIIIIHRSFLARSFRDDTFSYSRRSCIAAAKTIINEASQPRDEEEPVIWIDQAFCIVAGITLLVDMLNRKSDESEYYSHRTLGESCLATLQSQTHSPLAIRGIRLLRLLMRFSDDSFRNDALHYTAKSAYSMIRYVYDGSGELDQIEKLDSGLPHAGSDADSEQVAVETDRMPELFPPQTGFSNSFIFEDLLGFEAVSSVDVVR